MRVERSMLRHHPVYVANELPVLVEERRVVMILRITDRVVRPLGAKDNSQTREPSKANAGRKIDEVLLLHRAEAPAGRAHDAPRLPGRIVHVPDEEPKALNPGGAHRRKLP